MMSKEAKGQEKVKIRQGMPLPERFAEKMDELNDEAMGIAMIIDTLISRSASNRAKMTRLWREIGEEFDLDGKRWRANVSPKTDQEWLFEELDSHGMTADEFDDAGEDD